MNGNKEFADDFWNSYLVDQADGKPYFPTVLEADEKNQQMDMITTGYKYNTNISFGANYGNKFYIGAKFGFTSFKYDSKKHIIRKKGGQKPRAKF
jgi:hypothetical protein